MEHALLVQAGQQGVAVKLQHHKGAGQRGGGCHQLQLPGQRVVQTVYRKPGVLGKGGVAFDHGALDAAGKHRVGLGFGIAAQQLVVVQRGVRLDTGGRKLLRQNGVALFLAHGGQGQQLMLELAAAHAQRHPLGGQVVVRQKIAQGGGKVAFVGDNAVDQAALRQLVLAYRRELGSVGDGGTHRRVHCTVA